MTMLLFGCTDLLEPAQKVEAQVVIDYADVIGDGPQYYGVESSWVDQDSELYLERYRRLHGNVVRLQITQQIFEFVNDNSNPNRSVIDFGVTVPLDSSQGKTSNYDQLFDGLTTKFPDMYYQINIWLAAAWNASDPNGYLGLGGAFPPLSYPEHREFIRELARWLIEDHGISPDHLSFTFINEANLKPFFTGDQSDLTRLANRTHQELDEVSPLIRMGGLDEVHGTSWVDAFVVRQPQCCDFWTYHVYERGLPAMLDALISRAEHLKQYGPVWLTEFADTNNGSPDAKMDFSTRAAALGFAEMLGRLWPAGLEGIVHFRLSDTYAADIFGGWTGHGLFADARGTHANGQAYAPFAAYWVFANMYRELGGAQIVHSTGPDDLTIVGARKDDHLAVWIVNLTNVDQTLQFQLDHFPSVAARVQVWDNLASDAAMNTFIVNDAAASIQTDVPQRSSYLLVIEPTEVQGQPYFLIYLPLLNYLLITSNLHRTFRFMP